MKIHPTLHVCGHLRHDPRYRDIIADAERIFRACAQCNSPGAAFEALMPLLVGLANMLDIPPRKLADMVHEYARSNNVAVRHAPPPMAN